MNPSQSIPFIEKGGIKKRNTDAANTPLDHLFLFFINDIIDQIMTQTNLYHDQVKTSKPGTKFFTPTYKEEIMDFFGIILAMCITKLLEKRNYFHA